jgi:hypothetical protein
VVRPGFCAGCKPSAAVKLADGYGKALRLTIAFRYFECGANIGDTPWPKLLDFWGLPNL